MTRERYDTTNNTTMRESRPYCGFFPCLNSHQFQISSDRFQLDITHVNRLKSMVMQSVRQEPTEAGHVEKSGKVMQDPGVKSFGWRQRTCHERPRGRLVYLDGCG